MTEAERRRAKRVENQRVAVAEVEHGGLTLIVLTLAAVAGLGFDPLAVVVELASNFVFLSDSFVLVRCVRGLLA